MLIPIRCFTCGKTVSDKWVPFIKQVNAKKDKDTTDIKDLDLSLIHISEPTRPLYISYAVFCLKK